MSVDSLRLFAQACCGVVIGGLLAAAAARLLLPPDGPFATIPDGMLSWNLHRVYDKPREKGFYLIALVLGGACGYFATCRVIAGRVIDIVLWLLLLLSIPIGDYLIRSTLHDPGYSPAVAILLALAGGGLLAVLMLMRGRPLAILAQSSVKTDPANDRRRWPFFLALLAITLVLIPSSFGAVADRIGMNDHPVWFLLGPALYFLGHNLLPGIDYYTQYSIGMPWLFHFVMGGSAEQMVRNYVVIVILATWLFYAHLVHLLHWLYRSWAAAAVVALTALVLGFNYPDPIPAQFFAPSSSILRYPLLTVCAVLTGRWSQAPSDPVRLLTLAGATAAALFLETESGIVMAVSAPVALFLVQPWRLSIALPIVGFLAATVAILAAILLAVFGPWALEATFVLRLLDGILFYGAAGFGAAPALWTLAQWNWLYNLVAPGASLATIGVVARVCGNLDVDRKRAAVLAFLTISGLLLLVKWSNQSLIGVWQMSAIGPLAVLGWWCLALLRRIDPDLLRHRAVLGKGRTDHPSLRPGLEVTVSLRHAVAAAMIIAALIFLSNPADQRNPGRYGLRAWASYPSWPRQIFQRPPGCAHMSCMRPNFPAASDIAMIESLTRPGEQVAIVVDLYDWAYLVKARRAPLMFFLPSAIMFSQQQLQESLRRLALHNYIFVTKGPDGSLIRPYPVTPDVKAVVEPLLGTVFEKVGEGEQLVAWKRIDRP